MAKDLVSVIVPVYNVEKYIHRCINSVVAQTHTNIEIILVDDGSLDNCPSICDSFAMADKRVRVIHKANAGLGYARNSGIDIANGDYLMFIDSDDYIAPDAVEIMLERMQKDGSQIAIGKHIDVYDDGSTNGNYCAWMKDAVMNSAQLFSHTDENQNIAVSAWGKLYKRELFDGLRYTASKCAEDLIMFPKVFSRCETVSLVNSIVYYYYQRADSIVHKPNVRSKLDELEAGLMYVRFLLDNGYKANAQHWFKRAIDRSMPISGRADIYAAFRKHFSNQEIRQMLIAEGIKTSVKWLCLERPYLYAITNTIKHIVRRKAHE